jgi:hypothetical protein
MIYYVCCRLVEGLNRIKKVVTIYEIDLESESKSIDKEEKLCTQLSKLAESS